MNRFLTNKKLIILLISVLIFISLLAFSLNQSGTNPIQGVTNDLTAFVGRAFSRPANAILSAFDAVEDVQDTFSENRVLKRKVEQVYEKDAEIANLRAENEQLRTELDAGASLSAYNIMAANVISRNPDRWLDNIVVDVGFNDGVAQGMPVMNQNGLVGITSEVNHSSSKVTLLTNLNESSNQVSAEIILGTSEIDQDSNREANRDDENDNDSESRNEDSQEAQSSNSETNGVYGIISEYHPDRKEFVLTQVTADADINEGDLVASSGLGGRFPAGLLIGRVTEITSDNQGLGRVVYVEPATNFDSIRVVTVIDREAETILESDFSESEEE